MQPHCLLSHYLCDEIPSRARREGSIEMNSSTETGQIKWPKSNWDLDCMIAQHEPGFAIVFIYAHITSLTRELLSPLLFRNFIYHHV